MWMDTVDEMELQERLRTIGWQMAEHGIDEAATRWAADLAEQYGVAPVARAVLADADAPYIVRCRAFDRVAAAVRRAVGSVPDFSVAA